MTVRQPRYEMDEFVRRGEDIYHRVIAPRVTTGDDGKFVAVDIESGEYEIDEDDYTATERLLNRQSDAQIWVGRVGYPAAYRIGRCCGGVTGT